MYSYSVQQEDIDILSSHSKVAYCKIELLNRDMQILDSLEGVVFNDSFSCTGESTTRRSYNCDIIVKDSTFTIGPDKKIWINKYIRVYYGLETPRVKKKYYLLGTFLFSDTNYSYSSTENKLSLSCVDRMAELDGTRGGLMPVEASSEDRKLNVGEKYYDVIVGLLNAAGVTNYLISGVDDFVLPHDVEYNTGTTYCELLTTIRDIYKYWEFFFDEEGTFIWRRIPTGYGEDVIFSDAVFSPLVVSEDLNSSFQKIYNATEIWGQELNLVEDDRFANECTGGTSETDNVYHINLSGITTMEDVDRFEYIAIKVSGAYGKYININNIQDIPIYKSTKPEMSEDVYTPDTIYVFCYRRTINGAVEAPDNPTFLNFYCMGQFQCHGYYEETSSDVPYSIPNVGYKILNIIENDKLFSDEICDEQARYETYQTTAKQDTLNVSCLIIPFLEPTNKIKHTTLSTGDEDEWIVKNFSWSTNSGVMSLTLYRFLQGYEYVVNNGG